MLTSNQHKEIAERMKAIEDLITSTIGWPNGDVSAFGAHPFPFLNHRAPKGNVKKEVYDFLILLAEEQKALFEKRSENIAPELKQGVEEKYKLFTKLLDVLTEIYK